MNIVATALKGEIAELRKLMAKNLGEACTLADELVVKADNQRDNVLRGEVYHIKGMTLHSLRKFSEALEWYFKAFELRKTSDDKRGTAITLNNIGLVYHETNKWNRAIENYEQALNLKKEINEYASLTATLHNLGVTYQSLKDFGKASKIFYEALEIAERNGDTIAMSNSYLNIGNNHHFMGSNENALEMFQKALDLVRDGGNVLQVIQINNNLGNIHEKLKNYPQATQFYSQCLAMSQQTNYLNGMTAAHNNIGEVYAAQEKYEEALVAFYKCKELAESSENHSDLAMAMMNIGNVYLVQNNLAEVEGILQKALDLSIEIEATQQQQECYLRLSKLYEKLGRHDKALDNYKLYDGLKDKILNVENTKIINELKERYEAAMLKSMNEEMQQYSRKLEHTNTDLQLFAHTTSHDLREPLRMISTYMSILETKLSDKLTDDEKDFMHYAVDGAQRMDTMITRILHAAKSQDLSLHPVDLNRIATQAKQNLTKLLLDSKATFTFDPLPTLIGDDIQLLQIFQNLVTNALKYNLTDTPTVHISFIKSAYCYTISVADNGVGIDPGMREKVFDMYVRIDNQSGEEGSGIGLSTVKRNVERMKGKIWIEDNPIGGSIFKIELPLTI